MFESVIHVIIFKTKKREEPTNMTNGSIPSVYHYYFSSPFNAAVVMVDVLFFFFLLYAINASHQITQYNSLLRFIRKSEFSQNVLFTTGVLIAIFALFIGGAIQISKYYNVDAADRGDISFHPTVENYTSAGIFASIPIIILWTIVFSVLKAKGNVKKEVYEQKQQLESIIATYLLQVYKYDYSIGVTRVEIMEIINGLEVAKTKLQTKQIKRGTLDQFLRIKHSIEDIENNEILLSMMRFDRILKMERQLALYLSRFALTEKMHIRELVHADVIGAYERMEQEVKIQDNQKKNRYPPAI